MKDSRTTSGTHPEASLPPKESSRSIQCMEILGGNQAVSHAISSPGLDIWIDSRPFEGNVGGDIHYLSMCGSGQVTRLAVADVAGHGPGMNVVATRLRKLMRKYINELDQTRFAHSLNQEFNSDSSGGRFATILLTTYFAPTDHLIICNGGHPAPFWYQHRSGIWRALDQTMIESDGGLRQEKARYHMKKVANLPLGIVQQTDYLQFAVKLEKGDMVLIYTDAFIEAKSPAGELLGEDGLLRLAGLTTPGEPQEVTRKLIEHVDSWRGHLAADDDQTLLVLHHNAANPPPMTLGNTVRLLPKLLGLSRV